MPIDPPGRRSCGDGGGLVEEAGQWSSSSSETLVLRSNEVCLAGMGISDWSRWLGNAMWMEELVSGELRPSSAAPSGRGLL